MDFYKKTLLFTAFAGLLSGCELTEDDKKNLDKASVNLEKVAIAPLISFPAENKNIENVIEVIVDIDTSVQYKSLALLVDGKEVAIDVEAPYEFTWDPYFWSENTEATFLIRAVTEDDNLLRSEIRTVQIDADVRNQVKYLIPTANQIFKNINSTNISWTARSAASNYEYRVNGTTYNTTSTTESIALPQVGNYSLAVRAIDAQGHKGQWSDEQTISLASPDAPILYSSTPVAASNDWQVQLNWSGSLINSELQVATDINFISILESDELSVNTYLASLVTGIYYARIRTTNEFGHVSEWSDVNTLEIGLFSQKVDMHTYGGRSNEDAPVDFVMEDEHLVITARQSNESDGSGDDFYVSKVDLQGNEIWGKSYKPQINSAKSIALTSNGYVLPGSGTNWSDGKVMALDNLGNQEWSEDFVSSPNYEGEFGGFTQQRVEAITEISAGKFVALNRIINCIYKNESRSLTACPTHVNEVVVINRNAEGLTISSNQIAQPASGKYDLFTQLLLTDSGLYAAGRYTAANDSSQDSSADDFTPSASASGAVLLKLSKTDGSIISKRTAGGIKNSSLTSIAETKAGDIVVGYSNSYAGVASTFKADSSETESTIEGTMNYSKIVADPSGNGYVMLAQHRNNDNYLLTRYDENNNQVGNSSYLTQCFNQLRIAKIKSHPKYGIVILGTDKWGSSYSDTHTVYFNLTDDFKYACPE
ncbi:MAG: hypothetical protein V7765_19815 [Oleispira sp.]